MSDERRVCQVCRVKEPSVMIDAAAAGGRIRTYLCASCAYREEKLLNWGETGVSLSRLAAAVAENQARRAGADSRTGCPVCGVTLDEVVADGLLGCGHCYARFKEEVASSIRLTQGSSQHLGKSPFG